MTWLLGIMSPRLWVALAVGIVAVLLTGIIGSQSIQIAHLKASVAKGNAALSDVKAKAEREAHIADRFERDKETRRVAAQRKADDERNEQLARARADVATADAATRGLRARYAAALATIQARGDPAPAGSSAPTATDDLQTDLLGRILEIARQYVDAAEDAITRGELAERDYDALTP